MSKYLFFLTIVFIGLSAACSNVYAFDKCGQDCIKCHTLNAEEAKEALKGFAPDVKILDVRQGPLNGLWEVGIEAGGKKNIVYIDFSKKKVIAGNVFDIKTKTNYTQESFQKINKVDVSLIPLDNSVIMGDKDAKYKVVVFDDPEWPYCAKLHQEMKQVIEKRKDIAFYIKLFPLPMHKGAYEKSKAIVCENNSLDLLDKAFERQELPKPKCETTAIDDNIKLGQKLGISGTPALIFPDGSLVPGAIDADAIIKQVEKK